MPANGSRNGGAVPDEGRTITYERTFTVEDVREFGEVTGDRQAVQSESDEDGRVPVPELLTGSFVTKIGGDLRFVVRTIECDLHRPVYTGESVACEWTAESRAGREDRRPLESATVYWGERGDAVGTGGATGLVRK